MRNKTKLTIFILFLIVYLFINFYKFEETPSLISFLSDNVVFLFVSFLFINISALGIVFLEAGDLVKSNIISSISKTTQQIIASIGIQILIVVFTILTLIYFDSIFIQNSQEYIILLNIFIVSIFMYELTLLYERVKNLFPI